ncbi:MAG: ABC transporter permease [Akkermansiaceae bacterium]
MRILHILFKKELKQYFCSPFGWVVFAIIMLLQGLCLSSVLEQYAKRPVVNNMLLDSLQTPIFTIYFLFLFPLITMKLFSEEERSGTLETLMTAPIRTWQVVLSKYFAAFVFYCCLWLPLFIHIKVFSFLSSTPAPLNAGQMTGVFLILFLIGSFFVAVGCLASSLTSSQIIAAVVTFGLLAFHMFLGFVPIIMGESFSGAGAAYFFHYINMGEHINTFGQGLIDSRPFVYYLSMTLFTLLLTHHVVDYRRWKN